MLLFIGVFIGFLLLIAGGELLVRGAAGIAAIFGLSQLVIGLTVVAFGTSAPELGVSLQGALNGAADVAVGNVIGSNIINILLVLGVSACVAPLVVDRQLVQFDLPVMIASSIAMFVMAVDGIISRSEGVLLFIALVVYLTCCFTKGKQLPGESGEEEIHLDDAPSSAATNDSAPSTSRRELILNLVFFLIGLGMLAIGARMLVDSAVEIATSLGVSELVIGLTVVAIGTSLPEMVTSVVACYRGQRDMAVGNVVGSNLFNILCVLGLTSIVAPDGLHVSQPAIDFDLPVMVGVALICVPFFWSDHLIRRWEGILFVFYFALYTTMTVAAAQKSTVLEQLTSFAKYGLPPMVIVTVLISVWSPIRNRKENLSSTAE